MMNMESGWARWSGDAAEDATEDTAEGAAADSAEGYTSGLDDQAARTAALGPAPDNGHVHPFDTQPPAPPDVPPPSTGHLTRNRSHRARQDGPVTERLATKIEAAMWRSQRPAGAPGAPGTRPPAADSSIRPPSADTDAQPPSVDASVRPLVTDPNRLPPASRPSSAGDDRFAPPLPPAQPTVHHLPGSPLLQAGGATPGPASVFDETRPESLWPPTAAMADLHGLRAEDTGRNMPGASALAHAVKPGFMRQAERNMLWQRPRLRALLLGAVAGSALLLVVQVGIAYRDLLAARQPALQPLLQTLCASLGCKVQAARSIDSLAVESSGLVRVDNSPLYKLQVTLRNRANLDLALPALDVTFTDSKGDVISRKVLLPQDLSSTIDKPPGDHGGALAAGREVTLQGTLQSTLQSSSSGAPEAVAGYTVELFYP